MMQPLLTLSVMFVLPSAVIAGVTTPTAATEAESSQADWRREGLEDRVKAALTGSGWRLEDDGRAFDPQTKAPAVKTVLDKAVLDLRLGAQRAALESVSLMLASGKPLDMKTIQVLSSDLPPALVAALLDPKSDLNKVKSMADADLARVAAYFEGGRTLSDRQAAAQPISAGASRPRVDLPYYTALEKSVGEKIQASAKAEIGRVPLGQTVLSRLNTKGKPELPPIVIEDQHGPIVAQYDLRRKAIVLDRESVLASVVGTAPPRLAPALRASLSTRSALMSYLKTHPEAVRAVVKDNDAVLVHELTHAWQDRRDPIFREIARGVLPDIQPLEYEEEAAITKNLYIHSKLKHAPDSVKTDQEFEDYRSMMRDFQSWVRLSRAF